MKIDVHSHYTPLALVKEFDRMGASVSDRGASHTELHDISNRVQHMDKMGVDKQFLSINPPGVDFLDRQSSRRFSRLSNDEIAAFMHKNPERFMGWATVPFQDIEFGIEELDRAIVDLGLQGLIIWSNTAGRYLDSPDFYPIYERAVKHRVPIFLHSTKPLNTEIYSDFPFLATTLGWLFDNTYGVVRGIYSGMFDRFPDLKLIVSHLGAATTFLSGRINISLPRYAAKESRPLNRPPIDYIRRLYIDSVSHHVPSYVCAMMTLGTDHIVLGSDYPYSIWERTVQAIEELPISPDDKEKIFSENIERLVDMRTG